MGENEMIEIKTPETSEKVVEMPIVKTAPKKGKAEEFSLRGLDASGLPAAAALLAALVASKSKVRVEFSMTAEGGRTVNKIRAQS